MHQTTYIPLRVQSIRQESSYAKSFVLEQLDGKPIRYRAGQFLTLVFSKSGQDERRAYSISSTPLLNEPLTITVKRITNGEYSRYLIDHVTPGDILYTIGAAGYFTLPEDVSAYQQFFFLAAGSGIAPVLPLIKAVLHEKLTPHCMLIYSNRSPDDTIFLHEILNLRNEFPERFQADLLYSTSQQLLTARLSKTLLRDYVHRRVRDKARTLFYICGPFHYMQMATITLLTEGIPAGNVKKENFSTEKPVIKEQPPDVALHVVKILYDDREFNLPVQYPLTILEAAKQAGLMLPYNCEAGKCGTCAATCAKGKVWHSYNEVLVDRELAKGRILTCTAYPYGDEEVVITFPEEQDQTG
jgi:ring-1,2-phenylacetyl-CoA epoxidase subunit PaaE